MFTGEMMTCSICGKKKRSDPNVESGWTYILLDRVGYYVCPKHLQPPFDQSYERVLKRLLKKYRKGSRIT